MMQLEQTAEAIEAGELQENVNPEISPEVQMAELSKVAEMRHKTLSTLVGIHIDSFSQIMLNGNGVSYQQKVEAALALKEAINFALDFGVDVSGAKIRQNGKLAKQVNGLAGILVQALDNRMLMLAQKMSDSAVEELNEENNVNETEQGETNV